MRETPRTPRKVGLTMRVVEVSDHRDRHDALAGDWAHFLRYAVADVLWVALPNVGSEVVEYAKSWGLDSFILTGGNDIGEVGVKDETDFALLEYCLAEGLPAIGICRGLQVIHAYFGGELKACPAEAHVARDHIVHFTDAFELRDLVGASEQVNSFHRFGIRPEGLHHLVQPTAFSEDGWVEGAKVNGTRVSAVMWHPERHRPMREFDRRLVRHALGLDEQHGGDV